MVEQKQQWPLDDGELLKLVTMIHIGNSEEEIRKESAAWTSVSAKGLLPETIHSYSEAYKITVELYRRFLRHCHYVAMCAHNIAYEVARCLDVKVYDFGNRVLSGEGNLFDGMRLMTENGEREIKGWYKDSEERQFLLEHMRADPENHLDLNKVLPEQINKDLWHDLNYWDNFLVYKPTASCEGCKRILSEMANGQPVHVKTSADFLGKGHINGPEVEWHAG